VCVCVFVFSTIGQKGGEKSPYHKEFLGY